MLQFVLYFFSIVYALKNVESGEVGGVERYKEMRHLTFRQQDTSDRLLNRIKKSNIQSKRDCPGQSREGGGGIPMSEQRGRLLELAHRMLRRSETPNC